MFDKTRTDKSRNKKTREFLEITPIKNMIRKRRLTRDGHIMRRSPIVPEKWCMYMQDRMVLNINGEVAL